MKKKIILFLLVILLIMPVTFGFKPPISELDPGEGNEGGGNGGVGGGGGVTRDIEVTFNIDPYSTFKSDLNSDGHTWIQIKNGSNQNLFIDGKVINPNKTITISANSTYLSPVPLVAFNTELKKFQENNYNFYGTVLSMSEMISRDDFSKIAQLISYYNDNRVFSTTINYDMAISAYFNHSIDHIANFDESDYNFTFSNNTLDVLNTVISSIPSAWWDSLKFYIDEQHTVGQDLYSVAYGYRLLENKIFQTIIDENKQNLIDTEEKVYNLREELVRAFYNQLLPEDFINYPQHIISKEVSNEIARLTTTNILKYFASTNYESYEPFRDILSNYQTIRGANGNTNLSVGIWNYVVYINRGHNNNGKMDTEKLLFYPNGFSSFAYNQAVYLREFIPGDKRHVYMNGQNSSSGFGAIYNVEEFNKRFFNNVTYTGYFNYDVFVNI